MPDPKMIAKIKALLAKCDPGANATAAEIEAARAKAEELMDKYNIDQLTVDLNGEIFCEVATFPRHTYKGVDLFDYLARPVARFTSCRCWKDWTLKPAKKKKRRTKWDLEGTTSDAAESKFFGLPSDLVFAEWLLEMYVDYAKRWHDITFTTKLMEGEHLYSHWSRDFLIGTCTGISERLREARTTREAAVPAAKGLNALVVQSLVDRQLSEKLPDIWAMLNRKGRGGGSLMVGNAYQAGHSVGRNASTSRPVQGGTKLIGN